MTPLPPPTLFRSDSPLILASASPRRSAMLEDLGLVFTVEPADIDETPMRGELPEALAARLAESKALHISDSQRNSSIIAADTVVALDNHILGKPADSDEALSMLRLLNGRTHRVTTGLAITNPARALHVIRTETTRVTFADFNDDALKAYVRSGETTDKAGAYGIQGLGGFLVREVHGSYTNVVGLPLDLLLTILLSESLISPVDG